MEQRCGQWFASAETGSHNGPHGDGVPRRIRSADQVPGWKAQHRERRQRTPKEYRGTVVTLLQVQCGVNQSQLVHFSGDGEVITRAGLPVSALESIRYLDGLANCQSLAVRVPRAEPSACTTVELPSLATSIDDAKSQTADWAGEC